MHVDRNARPAAMSHPPSPSHEIGAPSRIPAISLHNGAAAAGIGPDGARNTLDAGWPAALHP